MIYCDVRALACYRGLSPALDTAIDAVLALPLDSLVMGRNAVDDERVFINRFDYQTKPETALLYEAHARYADIHLLLSGEEDILAAQQDALAEMERDEAADYVGLDGPCQARFHMHSGKALVVFPKEAHKVKCIHAQSQMVRKAVVKVLMDANA